MNLVKYWWKIDRIHDVAFKNTKHLFHYSTSIFKMTEDSRWQNQGEGRYVDASIVEEIKTGFHYFGNRICPFAHRAWWAIKEKDVNIDYVHIDLGPTKPAWYKELVNPFGTVPCLYDEGRPIFESRIVAEYLEEKFSNRGTQLMPADLVDRANIRLVISQFDEKLISKFYTVLRASTEEKLNEALAAVREPLKQVDEMYGKYNTSGPYFLGNQLSMAEITILPFIFRFSITIPHYRQVDIFADAPNFRAALEAAKTRRAFEETIAEPEYFIQAYAPYAN